MPEPMIDKLKEVLSNLWHWNFPRVGDKYYYIIPLDSQDGKVCEINSAIWSSTSHYALLAKRTHGVFRTKESAVRKARNHYTRIEEARYV